MTVWGVNLCRLVLAVVFLFSGFVKAADPVGMSYKVEAYFAQLGLPGSLAAGSFSASTVIAVGLAAFEFLLGVYLLVGMHRRFTSWCILIVMVLLTTLTGYLYFFSTIPDCGCFGDAIILSNRDTFLKNIGLLLCSVVLLVRPLKIKRLITERNQWIIALYSVFYVFVLSLYSTYHLPVIDFTPYKAGTNLREATEAVYETTLIFEKDGKTYACSSDSVPASPGKLVDARVLTLKAPEIENFALYNDHDDLTEDLLNDKSYSLWLVAPDLPTSEAGSSDMINDLYDICIDKGYAFYGVVSADSVAISNWVDQTGAAYPFVQTDRETAEAMMRSNPGVLLMKDGTILGKWGHNDLGHLVQLLEQQKESQIERFVQSEKAEGLPYLLVKAILWYIIPLLLIIGIDRIWISSKFYKHYIYKQRFNTNKNEKENRSR